MDAATKRSSYPCDHGWAGRAMNTEEVIGGGQQRSDPLRVALHDTT